MKATLKAALAAASLLACGGSEELPGSELMGRFDILEAAADPDEASGADCFIEMGPDANDPDCNASVSGAKDGVCPQVPVEENGRVVGLRRFPEAPLILPGFTLALSRNEGSEAFVTVDGRSRDAEWDGQVLTSTIELERVFSRCNCDDTRLVETLRLVLLSQSQNEALGGRCPADPFAPGAIPTGAGIVPPASTPGGFDAVRACGTLVDTIVPGEQCECSRCAIVYPAREAP